MAQMSKIIFFIMILALVITLAILSLSCNKQSTKPIIYTLKYEVTGSAASVDITYENADGGSSQITNSPIPWSTSFSRAAGEYVYISAQNRGYYGDVTVTIYRNNTLFKTANSSGPHSIATVSGIL